MFKSVLLYTNKLKLLQRFYGNLLGLNITDISADQFTVVVGDSSLIFIQDEAPAFYHFAINIPGNQFSIMKHWLKEKLTLSRERGIDERYYADFDADSMYFGDPAGNIVELIGRRKRDLFGDLTSKAFLNISEVGVVTPFMVQVGDDIQDFGIPLYHGMEIDPDNLNFLGKNDTFVVLSPPEKRWEFSERKSEVFPLEFTLHDGGHFILDNEGKIKISTE